MLLRLATAGAVATLAWSVPAVAPAAGPEDLLWATVNVCDTRDHPDEIGIRASMPGLERREAALLMRFRVQYYATADSKWHNFAANPRTDSGWMRVGRQRGGVVESGFNVRFKPPASGGAHHLRGAVAFRWKRDGRVVRRRREITEPGHRSTAGADPRNYSSATCLLS